MTLVCVDARPLATGHRLRGVGTYVAALITHLGSGEGSTSDGLELRYLWSAPDAATAELPAPLRDPAARIDLDAAGVEAALVAAGCDVYHATALESLAPSGAYATVATLYDLIPLRLPDWPQRLRHPGATLAYRRQVRQLATAEHILAISQATKADACALLGIPPERVSVVPLAADPARAHVPTPAALAQAQTRLGLRAPYFLGVASSEPHKNVPRLLEAFAAFRQAFRRRHPSSADYSLYIVGTWMGRHARRLDEQIDRLGLRGAVRHLTGIPLHEMAALYHGAVALVFPSLMEGFGLPVLEAMLCETAVITSNRSSLPEVAGDAALLVDPGDTAALAAALLRLASEPEMRADLIDRGRARSQQFSWARVAAETRAVYRRVAGSRSGPPASSSHNEN